MHQPTGTVLSVAYLFCADKWTLNQCNNLIQAVSFTAPELFTSRYFCA